MSRNLFKVFLICLISFQIINCLQLETGDNTTEGGGNSSDYNKQLTDNEDQNKAFKSILDKFLQIYNQNNDHSISLNVKHINQTFEIINNFQQNMNYLFKYDGMNYMELIPFLYQMDVQLSAQCSASLIRTLTSIKNSEIWALKFADSMGRFPPPGFIEGIQSSFGEFDECLDIRSPPIQGISFDGKYCLLNVKLPFPPMDSYSDGEPVLTQNDIRPKLFKYYGLNKLSTTKSIIESLNILNGTIYRLGICVPSVCTSEEIEDTLNKIFYPITRMPLEVERSCHMRDEKLQLDSHTWLAITVMAFLTLMAAISTCIDILCSKRKDSNSETDSTETAINSAKYLTLLLSFSILNNMRKLFAKNKRFRALDTIRLWMIFHIHLSHTFAFSVTYGQLALKKIFSDVYHKALEDNSMVLIRNWLPVDVLFTLSGFLLSYGMLRKMVKTKGRFNYFQFMFQRYIRFLVLVFGSILFLYIYPLTGSGPFWDTGVHNIINECKKPSNLWKNFLFINNFFRDISDSYDWKCNHVTWFLAALLQLIAIAPIFVIIFFKKPILGIYLMIFAVILSLLIAISPQLLFGIPPYLRIWDLDSIIYVNSSSWLYYHYYPTNYLISFLVGLSFGFVLFKNIQFTIVQERCAWTTSIITIVSVHIWFNSFWRLDRSAPLINALLWHTVVKLAFSLGVGWILLACCSGRAGYLNKFLSWNGFQPIARLSFGIYLLHNLVVSHRVFSVKNTYEMSFKYMLENNLVNFVYCIILATIFYLLIESPFSNILEALTNPKPMSKDMSKTIHDNKFIVNGEFEPVSYRYSIHL